MSEVISGSEIVGGVRDAGWFDRRCLIKFVGSCEDPRNLHFIDLLQSLQITSELLGEMWKYLQEVDAAIFNDNLLSWSLIKYWTDKLQWPYNILLGHANKIHTDVNKKMFIKKIIDSWMCLICMSR